MPSLLLLAPQHMLATKDFTLVDENGKVVSKDLPGEGGASAHAHTQNQYVRPQGQVSI